MADHDFRRSPVPYAEALAIQEELVRKRQKGGIGDTVWMLEHPPVLTLGTSASEEHVLFSAGEIEARGYEIFATRRGGDVTCHEPGQLVGYPIIDLDDRGGGRDLHRYLEQLEDAVVRLLQGYGLEGRTIPGRTGVWLEGSPPRKVAAIGVRCARWVTSHGFALNVENGLEGFRLIVPCGISDGAVTSLERELGGHVPPWESLCRTLHRLLEESLERPLGFLYGPQR